MPQGGPRGPGDLWLRVMMLLLLRLQLLLLWLQLLLQLLRRGARGLTRR